MKRNVCKKGGKRPPVKFCGAAANTQEQNAGAEPQENLCGFTEEQRMICLVAIRESNIKLLEKLRYYLGAEISNVLAQAFNRVEAVL